MLERELIQSRGFANTEVDGVVDGFTLRLRMPNYRGLWASLIGGVDVVVDGRSWSREETRWILQGHEYSLAELQRSTDVRWQLDEAATVVVPLPGGLTPGVHEVSVDIALYAPYIPAEFQPSVFHADRKVTIVA